MAIRNIDIIATILLNLVHCAYTEHILSCNVTQLDSCPGNYQVCNETSLQCYCLEGYVRYGERCFEKSVVSASSDQDATAAVVSIFTIALVVAGLVLVIRKYNLIDYVRHKINMRRNNDIMYEDVMIGQDDPPLVP
ncbi:uncharacterized protein LOC120623652 [Pararge aegeria]|uniref:Jg16477 protein n=2 Tax=Pararge aegeria TaxID=116150 RepID=A0A8S4RHM8_9NEOP|nr:uncharacterized protein LOC120623652 [Pararge aegeria]CAH2236647.1 jg16477 [Pararge aegeria aegeria]